MMEAMTNAFNLRAAAEENAGIHISDEEYRLALPAARHKLEYINNLSGAHHGGPYLAALIADAVKAQRLAKYLDTVNSLQETAR